MAIPVLVGIAATLASVLTFIDKIWVWINRFKTIIITGLIIGFMIYFQTRFFEIVSTVHGEIIPQFQFGGGVSSGQFSVRFLFDLIVLYPAYICRNLWDTSVVSLSNNFFPVRYSLLLVAQLWLAATAIFFAVFIPLISFKVVYKKWKYFEARLMVLLQSRAEQSK